MELTKLKNKITSNFQGTPEALKEILNQIEDNFVFPFNEYEFLICTLINRNDLTYEQYIDIRTEYINANPFLYLFEISAPRSFGEKFAQTYVMAKCEKLVKPSKELDANYKGQYDLFLLNANIKIEVKASRVVNSSSKEPLYMKALSKNTKEPFLMNFQQLKPQCCDIFIWVAVFRDAIILWIIGSQKILKHPLYSKGQHRGNKGNEGQMHITQDNIHQLNDFMLKEQENLENVIQRALDI